MIKLINFKNLTNKELILVLSWRNSENIAKNMKQKFISLEEHLSFIKNLDNDINKNYFLVKKDNEFIGVVYLVKNFLGIYASPNKKRVGDILLNEIINFSFKEKKVPILKAEVYKENLTAIKLYERFGFKTIKDNNNILIMELTNDKL